MNGFDIVILLILAASVYGGWRVGFIARSLSWAGLILGVVVGVALLGDVLDVFSDSTPEMRLLAGTVFAVGVGIAGQAVGALVARRFPRSSSRGVLHAADRTAGAIAGALGLMVLLWLIAPALRGAPGSTAATARNSAVLDALDQYAPSSPDSLEALSALSGRSVFPDVFSDGGGPPDAGEVPESGLAAGPDAVVSASTVKVFGQACRQIQEGSGFAIEDDLVVTNAHVVAGEPETEVLTENGRRLFGDVVLFDPQRDVAVVRVPGLGLEPLDTAEGSVGDSGAVYGHPQGGDLRAAPARVAEEIRALGTDIYHSDETERSVYVLAASLQAGDSGGPLVDNSGTVIGVAFAIDPGNEDVAYALTTGELEDALENIGNLRVDTGACVAP